MKKKQNILLFAPEFYPQDGGVSEFAQRIAECLIEEGEIKKIITFSKTQSDYGIFSPYTKRSSIHDIKRATIKKRLEKIRLISKTITFIHYSRIFLIAILELIALKIKYNPKVIVTSCYGYKQEIYTFAMSFLRMDFKLMLHGLDIIQNYDLTQNFFTKVCKKSKSLIFNSYATKDLYFNQYHLPNKPFDIHHPVINAKAISNLYLTPIVDVYNKYNISPENILITTVSRLVKRKGIDKAINTIVKLKIAYPYVSYIIAGKGSEFDYLNQLIKNHRAESFIKLIGFVSEQEKFSLLNASSIFLMPNNSQDNTDFEGFGISFIEASYLHNVVIGGKHGGTGEAINDNETGYLLPETDKDNLTQLLEVLSNLLNTPSLITTMANKGQQFVIDNFASVKNDLFINKK
ncbi:glycosyltransferase family 4 protein [Labilibacter sediminis]|nr:glycosyltransferase family 4 protein [Labilibacter sediminis]